MIEIKLDLTKPQGNVYRIHGRQGENGLVVSAVITDNAVAVDLAGCYVELCVITPDKRWVSDRSACKQVGNSNQVLVTMPEAVMAYPGICKVCYIAVRTESDELVGTTQGFLIDVDPSATFDAKLDSYSDQVHDLITELEILRGGFDQTLIDLKDNGQSLLGQIEQEMKDLANNNLAGYVDVFVQQSLTSILTTQVPEIVSDAIEDRLKSLEIYPKQIKGTVPPDKGGTGRESRRKVKEWLGIELDQYTVTFEGENFTVSTDGGPVEEKSLTVTEEDTVTFTLAPEEGHYIKSVKIGDLDLMEPYSIQVLDDTTVRVETGAIYDVTFSGDNCSIDEYPEKTAKMRDDETLTFNVTPSDQYKVTDVQAEGATLEGEGPYTLSKPTGAVTVTITTEADNGD